MKLLPLQSTFPCSMSFTSHLLVLRWQQRHCIGWTMSLRDLLRLSTRGWLIPNLVLSQVTPLKGHAVFLAIVKLQLIGPWTF